MRHHLINEHVRPAKAEPGVPCCNTETDALVARHARLA
jgi:hypothetical protein